VATGIAQGPKKRRRTGTGRIWLRVTRLEQQAVRAVARAEGLARGAILRRYSLDQILTKYEQLTNGK
jgi:hypothetical protein